MPNLQYVSTANVARALGIGVSTVKRWVDEGILPAHITAGGHRKLLLADVLSLVKEGDFPQLDLSQLRFVAETQGCLDPKALSQQLLTALKRAEGDAARSLIHGAHQSGVAMETLADFVIAPAMNQLGHEWETGRIQVLHEHRGTQLCVSVLYELRAVLEAKPTVIAPWRLAEVLSWISTSWRTSWRRWSCSTPAGGRSTLARTPQSVPFAKRCRTFVRDFCGSRSAIWRIGIVSWRSIASSIRRPSGPAWRLRSVAAP